MTENSNAATDTDLVFPLGEATDPAQLDAEADMLDAARARPFLLRIPTYLKLGGPGFMGAAATLGAGTLTSAMLSGAEFGYKMLWVSWLAIGSGVFMMAAMARMTTHGRFPIIQKQRERFGPFLSLFLTAFIAMFMVGVAFNFGQVALGTHLMEEAAHVVGLSFPQEINWILYAAVTAWISLSYGRGGTGVRFVENFMKYSLLFMILCFTACLLVVGVDWGAAARGFFIPWLPSGQLGIDLFIAASAAAIGVADWVFFQYAGLIKGWGKRHEGLARVDIGMGFALPFMLVYIVVVCVFAATLFGTGETPETATQLSAALAPLLGETVAQLAFLIGFLAVPITSSVALGLISAIGLHEALGWKPDVRSWRWKLAVLAPQIGLFGAFMPSPLWLIIIIAAFLSLTNNIVGWTFYLMANDRKVLGESRIKSRVWNLGILVQVTLLNSVAIIWVFNRLELWG
ncbi:MAG: divalent metal cation transporter [Pseudomonadota bacterium]